MTEVGTTCIYLFERGEFYKIGMSRDVESRLNNLSALPPFDLKLVCKMETEHALEAEAALHDKFHNKRKRGEWFVLTKEDVRYVQAVMAGNTSFWNKIIKQKNDAQARSAERRRLGLAQHKSMVTSIRFSMIRDLDIIMWLDEQPHRSNTIKRALRREMGIIAQEPLSAHAKNVLDDLVSEVKQMRKEIAQGVVVSGNGDRSQMEDDSEFDDVLSRIGV